MVTKVICPVWMKPVRKRPLKSPFRKRLPEQLSDPEATASAKFEPILAATSPSARQTLAPARGLLRSSALTIRSSSRSTCCSSQFANMGDLRHTVKEVSEVEDTRRRAEYKNPPTRTQRIIVDWLPLLTPFCVFSPYFFCIFLEKIASLI